MTITDTRCVIRGNLDAYDASFPCGCRVSHRGRHTYRRIDPTCPDHSPEGLRYIALKRARHVCHQCGNPASRGRIDGTRITYLCATCSEIVEEVK